MLLNPQLTFCDSFLQVQVVLLMETRSHLSFTRSDLTLSNLAFLFSLLALYLETAWIDVLKSVNYLVCTTCGLNRLLTNAISLQSARAVNQTPM